MNGHSHSEGACHPYHRMPLQHPTTMLKKPLHHSPGPSKPPGLYAGSSSDSRPKPVTSPFSPHLSRKPARLPLPAFSPRDCCSPHSTRPLLACLPLTPRQRAPAVVPSWSPPLWLCPACLGESNPPGGDVTFRLQMRKLRHPLYLPRSDRLQGSPGQQPYPASRQLAANHHETLSRSSPGSLLTEP